jgi:hypothetical protein
MQTLVLYKNDAINFNIWEIALVCVFTSTFL